MTKRDEKLALQMEYLRLLRDLHAADYLCTKEITEAIEAIRGELFGGNGEEIQLPYLHDLDNVNNPTPIPKHNPRPVVPTSAYSTAELAEELAKRAENPNSGVKVHKLAPHGEHATLNVNGYNEGYQETITGAHIYVVAD